MHPKLGRIVPELVDLNVRERFLYSYRLIYEFTAEAIQILAVIHGKRLLEFVERFSPDTRSSWRQSNRPEPFNASLLKMLQA